MRTRLILPVLASLTVTSTVALTAQQVRIDIVPNAGINMPFEPLGALTAINSAWYLDLDQADPSAVLGATAELTFPASRFGARILGSAILPGNAAAMFLCRPGQACPAVLLQSDAEVASYNAIADLVFAMARTDRFRPWIAAGAGIRHYDISWSAPAVLVEHGSHSETLAALHAAIGVDLYLGGGALRAEIGNVWSPGGDPITAIDAPTSATVVPGRPAQNDIQLSLGWRLFHF